MAGQPVCAYCRRRPAVPRWRPFCSERCKMADLGRWLQGDYKIPGPSHEPSEPERDEEPDNDR